MVFLKKGRQRQYHAYTRYFLLLLGFKIKLFALVKISGIKIFIKIESEIKKSDLINSVKGKEICRCYLLKDQLKFGKKPFATLPQGFLNI